VPAIPSGVIEPFLTQPLVVEAGELAGAPRIAAVAGRPGLPGQGRPRVCARRAARRQRLPGLPSGQGPLRDPETGKVLAHEAAYVGDASSWAAAKPGVDVHTFVVSQLGAGNGRGRPPAADPAGAAAQLRAAPAAAPVDGARDVDGERIELRGQSQVVTVNRGTLDGLDVGSVLQLYHREDRGGSGRQQRLPRHRRTAMRLPDEQYGELFIFRVFGHVSYGLVMQVTTPVQVGDVAKSPE
jgi:hypothetical protein